MNARLGVAILAPGGVEGALVQAIDAQTSALVVVRRCADLAEVRAAAGAGLARLGVIDGDDPDLDAIAVEDLHRADMTVVALTGEVGTEALRAIGVDALADPGDREAVVRALLDLADRAQGDPWDTDQGSSAPQQGGASREDLVQSLSHHGGSAHAGGQHVDGRLLVVWGTSGAPGRSTVALNVAAALSRQRPVVLVDGDLAAPSIAHMLGLPVDAPGVAALSRLAARGTLGSVEVDRALVPVSESLHVLTGLPVPQRWNEISPEALVATLRVLVDRGALVVVDTASGSLDPPPERLRHRAGRDEVVPALLRAADTALLVCRGDPVGINRLALAHDWWEELDASAEPAVVVNGVSPQVSGHRPATAVSHAVATTLPGRRVHLLPRDDSVPAALLRAAPVVDLFPASEAARALSTLAGFLGGREGGTPRRRRGRWRRHGTERVGQGRGGRVRD